MIFFFELFEKRFTRLTKIKDPVVRFNMMTEIFFSVIEIGFAVAKSKLKIEDSIFQDFGMKDLNLEDLPPETQKLYQKYQEVNKNSLESLEKAQTMTEKIFDDLSQWISSPQYDPDHPIGKMMMKECKESFENISNFQSSSKE